MYCKHCGKKISNDTMVCPVCGSFSEVGVISGAPTVNKKVKKKRKPVMLIVLLVLAIVIGGAYVVCTQLLP